MNQLLSGRSIAIYGRTKIGKTLDVNVAFSRAYVILCDPGGLFSVQMHCGRVPPHVELVATQNPTREALAAIMGPATQAVNSGTCSAVIFDNLSDFSERVLSWWLSRPKTDGRRAYNETSREIRAVVRQLTSLPVWTVGIFHEESPKEGTWGFRRGGMAVPGAGLSEELAARFSLIVRATTSIDESGEIVRVYMCDPLNGSWIMGDRFGAALPEQPMDLRPILWRILRPGQPAPNFPPKVGGHGGNSG